MKIIETKNYMELSKKASEILIKEMVKKPKAAFGLATGNTQIGMYKNLVKA